VFSPRTTGCSLGLFPSRATCRSLDRDFAQSPLTRFFTTALQPQRRRLRVSISLCSTSSARPDKPSGVGRGTLLGFLHRADPNHSNPRSSRAMCSPRAAPHIAAGIDRRSLGDCKFYRSCQDQLEVLSIATSTSRDATWRDAHPPFRVFGITARTSASPPWSVLSWVNCSFRVVVHSGIAAIG